MTNLCQNNLLLDVDAQKGLKQKVINDFNDFLKGLYKGYKKDYSNILNAINFIEVQSELDNAQILYQYFINNGV